MLLREQPAKLITGVYIHPNANVSMQEHKVRKGAINPHKATGPVGTLNKVLKTALISPQ